jgi:hypothetical protein
MRALTILTSGLMVFLGLAIVVRTVAAGGGAAAIGVLIGALFVFAGAGRLWVLLRSGEEER